MQKVTEKYIWHLQQTVWTTLDICQCTYYAQLSQMKSDCAEAYDLLISNGISVSQSDA